MGHENESCSRTGLEGRLPAYALRVLRVLEEAGYEAWVVGGWVRDALRGMPGHDVDVTTSARWQQTEACLRDVGIVVHETGVKHGTVTAVVEGKPVEITTYRVEAGYSDHRHPDEVRFVDDVRADLARRDFTINAMAWHPERGLLDPFGGQYDLQCGLIRAVGDPLRRFDEDALRVLRAVRFAARMGFAVEENTQRALVEAAPTLRDVALERIGQEVDGIVRSGRMGWALMAEPEVMCQAIPELSPLRGFEQHNPYHLYDVYEHTAEVCRAVEAFTGGLARPELRWAALLHDIGKPRTFTLDDRGCGHFYGHPKVGADMARSIMRRLALPQDLVEATALLVRYHDHVVWPTHRSMRRTMMKFAHGCPGREGRLAFELLDLKRSDAVAKAPRAYAFAHQLDEVSAVLRVELAQGAVFKASQLAVSGADVMATCGLAPGPAVGRALGEMLVAVVNGDVPNRRDELLAWLVRRGREAGRQPQV